MIDFIKNVEQILPYNRKYFIESFDNKYLSPIKWYGVSFQLPGGYEGKHIELSKYVDVYEVLFKKVIKKLDNSSYWIVSHYDKDMNWFPDDDENLGYLRTLFKEQNIPNTFQGALLFSMHDLLESSVDLISYPYAVLHKEGLLYKDLNVSHSEIEFVIKISGHLNIDFLSTDLEFLKGFVKENAIAPFILKKYKGTAL